MFKKICFDNVLELSVLDFLEEMEDNSLKNYEFWFYYWFDVGSLKCEFIFEFTDEEEAEYVLNVLHKKVYNYLWSNSKSILARFFGKVPMFSFKEVYCEEICDLVEASEIYCREDYRYSRMSFSSKMVCAYMNADELSGRRMKLLMD